MDRNTARRRTRRIVIAMALGILAGSTIQTLFPDSNWLREGVVDGLFVIGGKIFIASLKMLVVPLVFVTLVCGSCSLSDPAKLGRLGGKALLLYLITTALALLSAILMALAVSPGKGQQLAVLSDYQVTPAPVLQEVLANLIPENIIAAMAGGHMLQVIAFALLFGLALNLAGDIGKLAVRFFEDINAILMKAVAILMLLAPLGVFCLLGKIFADIGLSTLSNLLQYFLVVLFCLLFHGLVIYPTLLRFFGGLDPVIFIRKLRDVLLFSFSTASSNATIPVTLKTMTQKMGVSPEVASFVVPLGATINMDGTAIMQGVATVFIAQVYGIELELLDYLLVILTGTLASIGTAGVPGVGLIMLGMVLQQVGLPVEGIGLILGVDRLLDMVRTAVNVMGDSMVSCVVAGSEQEMDRRMYNDLWVGLRTN